MEAAGKILEQALIYLQLGFSVLPIRTDGTKAPALGGWADYQRRRAEETELRAWFEEPKGIAVVCGEVSHGLEVIDFDDDMLFPIWRDAVLAEMPELSERLLIAETPGPGHHVYLRRETARGSGKLALDVDGGTAIEIKGEGGYVIAPGGAPGAHPTSRPYRWVQGDLDAWAALRPTFNEEEYELLISIAKAFSRHVEPERVTNGPRDHIESAILSRPGDDCARRANWEAILGGSWSIARRYRDGTVMWRRPGKLDKGWSATTGACRSRTTGYDLFYVFTSNGAPFEQGRAYNAFSAYTILHHGGNYSAAAKQLAKEGYGDKVVDRVALVKRLEAARATLESGSDATAHEAVKQTMEAIAANYGDGLFGRLVQSKKKKGLREFQEMDDQAFYRYVARQALAERLNDLGVLLVIRAACFARATTLMETEELANLIEHVAKYKNADEAAANRSMATTAAIRNCNNGNGNGHGTEGGGGAVAQTPEEIRALAINALREVTAIPVKRITKSSETNGVYSLILDDETSVAIGPYKDVRNQSCWQVALGDTAKLHMRPLSRRLWEDVRQWTLDAVEALDDRPEHEVLLGLIIDHYIEWSVVARAASDEEQGNSSCRQGLIYGRLPIIWKGRLYVNAQHLNGWLRENAGLASRLTLVGGVSAYLNAAGFQPFALHSRSTTRNYYGLPLTNDWAEKFLRAKKAHQNSNGHNGVHFEQDDEPGEEEVDGGESEGIGGQNGG